MLRRIDGAVIAAALATVPLVVLDAQGVALMLPGISLFAPLGASVAAYFIESDTDDRLARIEEQLARIGESLKR